MDIHEIIRKDVTAVTYLCASVWWFQVGFGRQHAQGDRVGQTAASHHTAFSPCMDDQRLSVHLLWRGARRPVPRRGG